MDIVAIDFETYYDNEYSLTKATTEEYIRSPQFEAILVSIKVNDAPAFVVDQPDIERALASINWGQSLVICHNGHFDHAILSWRYGHAPAMRGCTMAMARALGLSGTVGSSLAALVKHMMGLGYPGFVEKGNEVIMAKGKRRKDFTPAEFDAYARYCRDDTENCAALFHTYMERFAFPVDELPKIDKTFKIWAHPIFILDTALCQQALQEEASQKEALLEQASVMVEEVRSDPMLAELLMDAGVEPPTKISKRTGEVAFAFAKSDKAFTDLQTHEDPWVRALVSARLGSKSSIMESRLSRFVDISSRGALPVPLLYWGTETGRWSGTDKINLQNLKNNSALRRAVSVSPGYTLVAPDLSQIEARTLAVVAGEAWLVEAFRTGEDPYSELAADIYKRPVNKRDNPDERKTGKHGILGCGYGCGGSTFEAMVWTLAKLLLPKGFGGTVVEAYRAKCTAIVKFWQLYEQVLLHLTGARGPDPMQFGQVLEAVPHVGVRLPNGLFLRYPELRRVQFEEREAWAYTKRVKKASLLKTVWGGKATGHCIQALAGVIIAEKWCRVEEAGWWVAGQVHDELLCVVRNEHVDRACDEIRAIMREPVAWLPTLPLDCEISVGQNYGDLTERREET